MSSSAFLKVEHLKGYPLGLARIPWFC